MRIWEDLKYALRTLTKTPGFTAIAVATLALGIGANTAIFTVVEGVLLRPLPYPEPDRLMSLHEATPERGVRASTFSPPNYFDVRDRNLSFTAVAAYDTEQAAVTGAGAAERIDVTRCTREFFPALGVSPAVGRAFTEEEERRGGPNVVILGHAQARKLFGGAREAVGKAVRLDGEAHTVVGVMDRGFAFPERGAAAWLPLRFRENVATQRGAHWLFVVARLKRDVTQESAARDLTRIATEIRSENSSRMDGSWTIGGVLLAERITGSSRTPLLVLLGAVALVLLIACANVANLLLARGTGREAELAIRTALGATRARLVRQLLTENLLLALAGSAAGMALAAWAVDVIVRAAPANLPRLSAVGIDGAVLLFTTLLAVGTVVLFGLLPALRSTRAMASGLASSGRGSSASRESAGLRHGLVVGEIAVSLLLLAGAGLLVRSFVALETTDPGFTARNVLTYEIQLPEKTYPTPESQTAFYDRLFARTRALPGVTSAAAIFGLPLTGTSFYSSFLEQGAPEPKPEDEWYSQVRVVSRDYFRTIGLSLVRGRVFGPGDRFGSPPVILASASAAHKFWPGSDPIGKRIRFGASVGSVKMLGEVVGIVGDVRDAGLAEGTTPLFYASLEQAPVDEVSVVVASASTAAATGETVPPAGPAVAIVRELDRDIPVADVRTISEVIERSVARPKFAASLLSIFAATALLLATIGTYGVLAYSVGLRRREIGVRAALGADPSRIVSLVMRQGARLALLGTVIGLAGALAATRLLSGLLFGVGPRDLVSLSGASLLLGVVSLVACAVPALRAARIPPSEALRTE
jgi:putative ABC transport system permease protein